MSGTYNVGFHDPDEEYCRSKFDSFLRRVSPAARLFWEDGDEPPDYYFRLDDDRYAVEVTRFMGKLSNTGKDGLDATPQPMQFIDEIERIAQEENILRGLYLVRCSGKFEKSKQAMADALSGILDYLEDTMEMETAAFQSIFEQDGQFCGIEKRYGHPDVMHNSEVYNQIKSIGDVVVELPEILEERLVDKVFKLRNIIFPKIVLLYDWYHFADPQLFAECVAKLPSLTSFHTVFIVQNNREGFLLYSQSPDWQQAAK